jgi:hypothetical protein
MAPAIGIGSVVIVDPVDPADLLVGDMVSCGGAGPSDVHHRIIRTSSGTGRAG